MNCDSDPNLSSKPKNTQMTEENLKSLPKFSRFDAGLAVAKWILDSSTPENEARKFLEKSGFFSKFSKGVLSCTTISSLGDLQKNQYKEELFAAVKNNNQKLVRELLQPQYFQNVSQTDKDGNTPLHWAGEKADPAMCRLLIKYDTSNAVKVVNHKGETPLHSAARARLFLNIPVLLEAGVDPSIESALPDQEPGKTVLELLEKIKNENVPDQTLENAIEAVQASLISLSAAQAARTDGFYASLES